MSWLIHGLILTFGMELINVFRRESGEGCWPKTGGARAPFPGPNYNRHCATACVS